MLKEKLGPFWDRALKVFRNYGKPWSYDVLNVLLHAADEDKAPQVLEALENHWDGHLVFQHPDIRGKVILDGVNPTEKLFVATICEGILGLSKAESLPQAAQKFLERLYAEHGAVTIEQKIAVHEKLNPDRHVSSATGALQLHQVLGAYELVALEENGLLPEPA